MKNRVNIQASNGSTMKTDCSKTMFWQLQIQGALLFLMLSALKSNDSSLVTSHSHEGSTGSLSE